MATSDGLEQIIIRGQGCRLLSARDLQEDIELAAARLRENIWNSRKQKKATCWIPCPRRYAGKFLLANRWKQYKRMSKFEIYI